MSAKNLDQRGRFRNKIVAFRVSPEEDELIEAEVRLSGHTKQDYIISRLMNKTITVQGNPKVYKALKDELKKVLNELSRIEAGSSVDPDLIILIKQIATIMEGMQHEDDWR